MKKIAAILLTVLFFATGCGSSRQVQAPATIPVVIRVECKDETTTRQFVIQVLRMQRASSITINDWGDYVDIEATYANVGRDNFRKQEDIEKTLSNYPGVLYVEIKNATRPVMNTF